MYAYLDGASRKNCVADRTGVGSSRILEKVEVVCLTTSCVYGIVVAG